MIFFLLPPEPNLGTPLADIIGQRCSRYLLPTSKFIRIGPVFHTRFLAAVFDNYFSVRCGDENIMTIF